MVIRLAISPAGRLGAMDRPGGHKQHAVSTPFVGGLGLISVLVVAFTLGDHLPGGSPSVALLAGSVCMFVTGMADDIWHLGCRSRFAVQAAVALAMVFVGGVELASFGELLPAVEVDLGWLALPMTVFATIGLINAVNMIDGIDGLSGSVSLVSLVFIAVVALLSGNSAYLLVTVALMGGVAGFLFFNLRYPGNPRARVFLGDNGSMLLGFVFAWLLSALSQGGEAAAMTPVTALWLFALPLMDTIGVMVRRIWLGKSPFRADRHHLHHLLVRAGFRVCDVVAVAVLMQIVFALIGVGGLLLGVPEYLMFWLFLGVFAVYLLIIARPWRLVPWLQRFHRRFGLPSTQVRGIFVGYARRESCPQLLGSIAQGIDGGYDYQLSVFETGRNDADGHQVFFLVHVPGIGDEHLIGAVRRDALRMRRRLGRKHGLDVRLLLSRAEDGVSPLPGDTAAVAGWRSGGGERRELLGAPIYSIERGRHSVRSDHGGFELSLPPPGR
jgi:undecaprenyl-phosphate alpha-N-acetylglucosaminyl 1-phosphatetransferase